MKILKYLDLFGINFHFYIGNKRKLYTSYGGIISLICIFCCLLIFSILTYKDLNHKNPISDMSSISQAGYHKMKFDKEKFWIPWRIIDYKKKLVNFTNLLYPMIYIKKGDKNISEDIFNFKITNINYKLCNETDFARKGNHHFIDVALDEIFCVELDNIELGGGWTAKFLNYLQLDIYICKEGVEYNETDQKCTKYQKLKDMYSKNYNWAFEYFYPIVEFQPTNYDNPILVTYKNHFYNFSSYLNKDERMYIQEYILNDDKGLIFNDDKNSSFWGFISSDFDVLYSNGDLLNEKHSSKLYSLSIFLDTGKILYIRRYYKLYTVIANVFPIFNVVFLIFDFLTYMIKTIMTEKYLSELFFQRINETDKINFDKEKRKSAGFFVHKLHISRGESFYKNSYYINRNVKSKKNNKTFRENNFKKYLSSQNIDDNKNNDDPIENNNPPNIYKHSNKSHIIRKMIPINNSRNSSKKINSNNTNFEKLKKVVVNKNTQNTPDNNNNNSSLYPVNSTKINNFVEINFKNANNLKKENNPNKQKYKSNKSQILINDMTYNKFCNKNGTKTGYEEKNNEFNDLSNSNFHFHKNRGLNNSVIITKFRLKGSLFSMKDYIYSFFIKAVRKEYKYLSKEFAVIFNFLSNIYDISSYLQLYKQFHIISGFLIDNGANIDINHKININNKELFKQIAMKNKNIFYFALKEQFNNGSNK